jgi:heat shock protein HslJ
MDDAIGRRTPPNPAAYTLRFGADGMATLQLDCNRGQAPWQATTAQPSPAPRATTAPRATPPNRSTASQEVSGSLRFGPLALTRALCPPPSLSDTVARQLPFVRSFLLRNNRLYLSLMADGGILEWQPLPGVPYRAVLSPEERKAILAGLDPATRRALAKEPNRNRAVVARLDLNADGRAELFAYLMGPLFCGTGGCTLQLFTPEPRSGGWRLVQTFPITRLPLIVAPATSQGWRDLWRPEAGGGAPSSLVRERFDGQRYRPSERRSPQPTPTGTAVLVGDPGLGDGAPL